MARLTTQRFERRARRHRRVRKKISGTAERPRFSVFKSSRHIHAQLIDDDAGHTLVQVTTMQGEVGVRASNQEAAKAVGKIVAQRAIDQGIETCVFDRGGYPYHGVVKALAESAREGGLKF